MAAIMRGSHPAWKPPSTAAPCAAATMHGSHHSKSAGVVPKRRALCATFFPPTSRLIWQHLPLLALLRLTMGRQCPR
eukprot:356698-Chlamydomonas_euryale.AAC.2